jgi:hypothetical protein
VSIETGYETGNGFPLRWPLYYVGAQGLWDPSLASKQLLSEACRKLYGPAAEPMLSYYMLLERAARGCKLTGGNWNLPKPADVYPPQVLAEARALLDRAAEATDQPEMQIRVQQEREILTNAAALMGNQRTGKQAESD